MPRNPTTVMTANGEVQTREEATVYAKELDLFVTVMLLEETFRLGSSARSWVTSGQKPHLTKKGKRIVCNISNYVAFVLSGLSTSSSTSSSPTSSKSSSQDFVNGTENPATERSGSMRAELQRKNQQKLKTQIKMKTTKNYEVEYCGLATGVQREFVW